MNPYLGAAYRLHQHISQKHWNGKAISGPDPIGKINWRITRFVKSYTRWIPWPGNLTYLQAQSYWIEDNLYLSELIGEDRYLEKVERCADYVVSEQRKSGAWEHPPLWERKGFISAVETVWACLGLCTAYKKVQKPRYLEAIKQGYDGLIQEIGLLPFGEDEQGLGLNYHAHTRVHVPNVTTMFLWLIAELYQLTGDESYMKNNDKLIYFLEESLMENGELQYIYEMRPHFQSYQYNSYQFLDLVYFYELTENERIRQMLIKIAQFLSGGMTERGSCRYDNFSETPEVNYWTGILAMALRKAHELDLGDYKALSEKGYQYLLGKQKPDGSFAYSKYNYKILQDQNSYPRYLAMILNQLLYRADLEEKQTG